MLKVAQVCATSKAPYIVHAAIEELIKPPAELFHLFIIFQRCSVRFLPAYAANKISVIKFYGDANTRITTMPSPKITAQGLQTGGFAPKFSGRRP